jgi:excinuclease UvrABC nuclease subunit
MLKFLYTKELEPDKYSINMYSKNEQLIGYITFVIPSQQTLNRLLNKKSSKNFKKWWEDQYLNKPYVDYSFINIEYRNKGYGKRLYKAASLCLKLKYGLKLYASGNQSKEAKNLWQSLKKENDPYFIITGEYLEAKIKS